MGLRGRHQALPSLSHSSASLGCLPAPSSQTRSPFAVPPSPSFLLPTWPSRELSMGWGGSGSYALWHLEMGCGERCPCPRLAHRGSFGRRLSGANLSASPHPGTWGIIAGRGGNTTGPWGLPVCLGLGDGLWGRGEAWLNVTPRSVAVLPSGGWQGRGTQLWVPGCRPGSPGTGRVCAALRGSRS